MGQYSIKEVETLSGVKAHTLRIWEQRYDFLKPKRTDTNIRYYTDEQLRLLLNIGTLNRNGMKISKIAELGKTELSKQVMNVYDVTHEPDYLLDSLIHSMLDFDERRFEKTLNSAILKLGFDETFGKLIFPFMTRTGALWTTGAVRVAQEHFISNLIRRKILVAIDGQHISANIRTRKFILFLPEGETHELLLMFSEYLLRKHNHEVIYIGASLPLEDLAFIYKTFKPDYLVTFITAPMKHNSVATYIKKLCAVYPQSKIVAGGAQLVKAKFPSNYLAVSTQQDFLNLIQ